MSEQECFELLRQLLAFPCAQICRHYAAALVLEGMSRTNPRLEGDPDFIALAEAVYSEGDERALAIIDQNRRKNVLNITDTSPVNSVTATKQVAKDEEGRLTYAGLKEVIDRMTPEQLAMPVTTSGDGGYRRFLIDEGETLEEADRMVEEEPVVVCKGQVFLSTEK